MIYPVGAIFEQVDNKTAKILNITSRTSAHGDISAFGDRLFISLFRWYCVMPS